MSVRDSEAPALRAMVVDDHHINREQMLRQLLTIGIHAEPFENGRDALHAWSPGAYDVVITDCHMPLLDGYALTRAIRRQETELGLARMPIIAWTVNLLATEVLRCRAAGMDDVMRKPSSTEGIRTMLARWVGAAL